MTTGPCDSSVATRIKQHVAEKAEINFAMSTMGNHRHQKFPDTELNFPKRAILRTRLHRTVESSYSLPRRKIGIASSGSARDQNELNASWL